MTVISPIIVRTVKVELFTLVGIVITKKSSVVISMITEQVVRVELYTLTQKEIKSLIPTLLEIALLMVVLSN